MTETGGDIVLIGAGGHCASIIDLIESAGEYRIIGIADRDPGPSAEVLGYPVRYSDDDLAGVLHDACACITVGQIDLPEVRRGIWNRLSELEAKLPVIVPPTARVSPHARIGDGTTVGHGAVINARAVVGRCCILNTQAVVEHDAVVGDFTHISTGACVNGEAVIGSDVFLGSNASVRNGVNVGDRVIIGMGSVVTRNITEPGVYVGSPARKIR